MDTLDIRERAGTDPTMAAVRRATDDAQIRIRRVLALLNAAHGSVIHDLTNVIDGPCDPDVVGACEDVRNHLGQALASTALALRWAVDASGGNEVHETPEPKRYAAVPHVRAPR